MKRFFTLLILLFSFDSIAQQVVVVNASNTSSVSNSDIKNLFLGKRNSFESGSNASLSTLESGNPIREKFNNEVLNKNEAQYTGYWAKMTFTGRATPPKEFKTSKEVKEFVATNPNAIGIIEKSDVDSSVRVVLEF